VRVLEALRDLGGKLPVALVVGSVPKDGSGDVLVLFANRPAAILFGFLSEKDMVGIDIRTLMLPQEAREHRRHVEEYLERSRDKNIEAFIFQEQVLGKWRNFRAQRHDGVPIEVQIIVSDFKAGEDRYFVSIFRDRSEEVQAEKKLQVSLEKALQRQETLSKQIDLLLRNLFELNPASQSPKPPERAFERWELLLFFLAFFVLALLTFFSLPA
jgi:PAS domain S-box-containing protein